MERHLNRKTKVVPATTPQKCIFCSETFSTLSSVTNLIHKADLERNGYPQNSLKATNSERQIVNPNEAKTSGYDSGIPHVKDTKDTKEAKSAQVAYDAPYECLICSSVFASKQGLDQHLIKHINRYECERCDKTFSYVSSYNQHMRRHLGIKPFQCTVCKAAFVASSPLYRHMRTHEERESKCEECGRKFFKKNSRDYHKNMPHKCPGCLGTKPHKCKFCQEAFASPAGLTRHLNLVHKEELERDGYGQISSTDTTSEERTSHATKANRKITCKDSEVPENKKAEDTKEGEAPYECLICSNVFTSRNGLDRHLIKHINRYECEHCGQTFSYSSSLEQHIRRHLGIKPYKCTECKATFATKAALNKHMRTHTGLEHKCDKCGREFSKRTSLDEHRNKHLRLKPYKCSLCPAAFSLTSTLMRHTNNIHKSKKKRNGRDRNLTDDSSSDDQATDNEEQNLDDRKSTPVIGRSPPFICPVCTKVYAARTSLIHHLVSHTNRHKCDHCKKCFTSAAHLKKHGNVHARTNKETTTMEIRNVESTVEIEAQDSVLKDAICFEDEQEFKPTVEIVDDITTPQATSDFEVDDKEPKQGSQNESTGLREGKRNLITSFRPIRVNLTELQNPTS